MAVGIITEDVIMTKIVTDTVTAMEARHIMDVMVIMATMDHPIMGIMVVKCISDLGHMDRTDHMDRMDHMGPAHIPGDVTLADRWHVLAQEDFPSSRE